MSGFKDCPVFDSLPEGIKSHILAKKELHLKNGLDEATAERNAINDFKKETVETLADVHSQLGNKSFERIVEQSHSKTEVPPIEPPTEEIPKASSDGIGITHAETSELRKETGLPGYDKEPQTIDQWREQADKRIANGEMPSLIKKMERGDNISETEQIMMGKHIATLDAEVAKNPTNENLKALKYAVDLSDKVGGTAWGRSGRARQETFLPDDSLGTSLIKEMDALGVNELPEKVKEKFINEHEELAKLKIELEKSKSENERLQKEASAKDAISKISKTADKKANAKRDFKAEKQTLKDKLKQLIEDYKASGQKLGIISDGGVESFVITAKMAKTIGEYVKVNIEEGVSKFEDLVNKVYDDIKEFGVSKNNIIDVIRGAYNEKKPTRNELVARLRDFRTEATLLKKLADERLGKVPNTTKEETRKKSRITELENKIKEVRKLNKDNEAPEIETDGETLAAKRKSIQKRIDKIEADVKAGIFELPEKKPYIKLDRKTQALQDRLIELEQQQLLRRQKAEYERSSKFTKVADTFWQVIGLRRLVNAAVDFSILFRQAAPVTMNALNYLPTRNKEGRIIMGSAPKAIGKMFNVAFDPKGFARFQYNLEKSDEGRLFTHFNGVFSNPTEVKMEKRDEEASNNILARIHQKIEGSNNEALKKSADVANAIWFSERAAAGLLNSIRIQEFSKGEIALRKRGITPENSPKDYEDLVKWVMNITGRGNMLKALEDSHAGRVVANRAYFGARLMAAKINMLNPATWVKMSHAVRIEAMKDMAGYVSTLLLAGLALKASGATISLDWDEPDFLQARFGDKVFDISGGSVGYIRTFLRFVSAIGKQIANPRSKSANSYSAFAGKSIAKTMITNKLSPNTAYLWHAWTGKSGDYDENGKLKPFDPLEFAEIYPLYVDGTIKAFKEGGMGDAMSILLPDLFGIGTQQYDKKGGSGGGGGASGTVPKAFKEPTFKEYKPREPK